MNSDLVAASDTVLLLGSGGREHAMAWKLAQSPLISRMIAAPGNDGFSSQWERWEANLSLEGENARIEFERLAKLACDAHVSLAIVGPDNPLAEGIVDIFERHGVHCFGPSSSAARIEASKTFAKDVMKAAGVPTAKFFTACSDEEARKILKSVPWRKDGGWVIKADGLALGKGVRVCSTFEEASLAATELLELSGALVIEERLFGEEISWLAFCDGENCALLEPARDHKTLLDGNLGPNTGGMGAYSPVQGLPASWEKRVREEIFEPVLREMKKRDALFKGVLYVGLMCDFERDQFWVLEFNARFGDPETQVLLARMEGDLYEWCVASVRGKLAKYAPRVSFKPETALVVVGAANGYPENPEKGREITGLIQRGSSTDVPEYFFAGVKRSPQGRLLTAGGRVFGAMGVGVTLERARVQAYQRMNQVSFEQMRFRHDIGAVLS